MGAKLPLEQTKAYQRKQAAIKRRQLKQRATKQQKEVARRASKDAINKIAEEAFGEGGLTPARVEALAAVVTGSGSADISITSPNQFRYLIRKAREKFTENAEAYMAEHLNAVRGANADKQYDVAARHAEWAMEAFGDVEERVIDRPLRITGGTGQAPIMVGVNLGGVPNK